mgnify:CR=1 FL=1
MKHILRTSTKERLKRAVLPFAIMLGVAGMSEAAVPPLSVSGNQVLSGGEPVSFAGNSLFTRLKRSRALKRNLVQVLYVQR